MVDGGPRSASAEALEPTVALLITRPVLLELAARDRALTEALLQVLGGLLRRLTEQASDLVSLDLPGRVAKLLAGLAAERGLETPEGVELDAALTQTDLAGMVRASRQSINQLLQGSPAAATSRSGDGGSSSIAWTCCAGEPAWTRCRQQAQADSEACRGSP